MNKLNLRSRRGRVRRKKALGGQLPEIPEEALGLPVSENDLGSMIVEPEKADALGNIVGGASQGSAAGPWGALAGALKGGYDTLVENEELSNKANLLTREKTGASSIGKPANAGYLMALDGADLSKRVKTTEYEGNSHEQGGIPLDGLGVEVEGGETRTGEMVFTDNPELKVDTPLIKAHPNVFKKTDKGKTMADVSKRIKRPFDKRKYDEWNDQASLASILPLEDIQRDISETSNQDTMGLLKAEDGMDMDELMGYAPLATNLVGLGLSLSKPETVDYPSVGYDKADPTLRSADPGIQRLRTIFGNARNRIRKYNPSGGLARESELASREADAVTQVAGQVDESNQRASNTLAGLNAQLKTRVDLTNASTEAAESDANAANRGSRLTNISANIANLGTISGQMSKDEKLLSEQIRSNKKWEDLYEQKQNDLYGEPDLALASSVGEIEDPLAQYEDPRLGYRNGGSLAKRIGFRKFKTF